MRPGMAGLGKMSGAGEGRWTIPAAVDEAVPVHGLSTAWFTRFRSRHAYTEKMPFPMQQRFSGHVKPGTIRRSA